MESEYDHQIIAIKYKLTGRLNAMNDIHDFPDRDILIPIHKELINECNDNTNITQKIHNLRLTLLNHIIHNTNHPRAVYILQCIDAELAKSFYSSIQTKFYEEGEGEPCYRTPTSP